MHLKRLIVMIAPLAALAIGLTTADGDEKGVRSLFSQEPEKRPDPFFKHTGSLSCASASCHGASYSTRPGSEYTIWATSDPHFRSYDALTKPESRRMAEILNLPQPAHQSPLCLNCHAPQIAAEPIAKRDAILGVGCEDCHGPAERYRTEHYTREFKSLSRREKAEQYGLYPTKDLAFRISQCSSCHVGDANREVNHDLIAAGHPRLAFEYTGYHHSSKYKRHWKENAYGPDFDVRAWEIGQTVCAARAADLLKVRAERAAEKKSPWPELSEHSCFACHKGLDAQKSWKPVVESKRKPGSMPWGTWYFAAADLADRDPPEARNLIDELRIQMEAARPNEAEVAKLAGQLSERFRKRTIELQQGASEDSLSRPYSGDECSRRLNAIVRTTLTDDGSRLRDLEWDGATQRYLAAGAMYYSWAAVEPERRDPRLRQPLLDFPGLLKFPKEYNSPKDADPASILRVFQQLRSVTQESGGKP